MAHFDKRDWYIDNLMRINDRMPSLKGNSVIIQCPNPEHRNGRERTPSLFINVDPNDTRFGKFFCYGCKIKGDWNELAVRLPALPTEEEDENDFRFRRLSSNLQKKLRSDEDIDFIMPKGLPWPLEKSWRKIPGRTVRDLGGIITISSNSGKNKQARLFFPVGIFKPMGGVWCAIKVDKERKTLKYDNVAGPWVNDYGLFGYGLAKKMLKESKKKILLVGEGPRDGARPLSYGYPAVGLLGSHITDMKVSYLEEIGAKAIIIATDPDGPGKKAAEILKEKIKSVPTVRMKFKVDEDGRKLEDLGSQSEAALKIKYDRCLEKL